jgi:mutator family transposase
MCQSNFDPPTGALPRWPTAHTCIPQTECERSPLLSDARDPKPVVGDGAMGLWKAPGEVFPAARHQRCWVHKARNVTNALPKSAQLGAMKATQEIHNAEDRAHAGRRSTRSRRPTARSGPRAATLAVVFKLVESAQ